MYQANFAKIDGFFNDYKEKIHDTKVGLNHLKIADEIISYSSNCEILYYKSTAPQEILPVFIIIPSIFNSVEILFLNSDKHFINHLKDHGDVYLINWLEIDDPYFGFDHYVTETIEITSFVSNKTAKQINLIGHCIGGNIALAASFFIQNIVKTLTLLTTPWDFSHLKLIGDFHKKFNLDAEIQNLTSVPKIYLKILFFLMFPDYFNLKIDKYFEFKHHKDKQFYLNIEHWLMSGVSLPKAAYFQIINEIMVENLFMNKKSITGNETVEIENFKQPLFIVVAKNDQLVPRSSVLPLIESIKNVKLLELKGGHISYLIGSQLNELFVQYKIWLGEN